MNNSIVILMVLSFCTLRPSALGQEYTVIALVLQYIAIILFLITRRKLGISFSKKKYKLKITLTIVFFWAYCLFQTFVLGTDGVEYTLKAAVASISTIIIFYILLSNEEINFKFFRTIAYILKFTIVCWIITLALSFFIDYDNLYMFQIKVGGYENGGKIYFPFTILYGFMTVGVVKLPRLLSLFREAGISQIVFIWFYFNLKTYKLDSNVSRIIFFVGIIATFSTAGMFLFFFSLAIKYLLEKGSVKKYFVFATSLSLAIYLTIYAPGIGLASKSITHSTSITDRSNMMLRGIEKFIQNPIGQGMYSDLGISNVNINFIATMYTIGIIGVILFISIFLIPAIKRNNINNKRYIYCILPLFISIMISQPLIDAPMLYILLLADY